MPYVVYILRCADGTLYTGIAKNIKSRLREHNTAPRGARYTRGRRPVRLVYRENAGNRSSALKREAAIKRMPREKKLALLAR